MRHESCQESVQDTINHAFPTSTMLAVAHRLETIMEFLGHQVMMLL
jgi:ABC-type multidrug transport system fused ATPase/permease subunit